MAGIVALFSVTAHLQAQAKAPPTDSVLAAITERGRSLAAYDFAAWHGTDAVEALKPPRGSISRYIARHTDSGWSVAFGHLGARRDTFFVAYEAVPGAQSDKYAGYIVTVHPVPVADTGYFRRAAMAVDTAQADFGRVTRPYNVAVLPATEGKWWVYLIPAPTVAGVWPLGGDVRYLISADGHDIISRRQLHKGIIEYGTGQSSTPGPVKAGAHSAILDDIPEDTDVFLVLERSPKVPEYIVTNAFVFRIDISGSAKYMGRREALLGK